MKIQKQIKYMTMMKKIVWLLSIFFVFSIHFVFAQTGVVAPPGVNEQISIKVVPEKPQPGDKVKISIESFSANLNKAYIIWSINGATKSEGPGKTVFEFTNGKAGSVQNVSVEITTEDQRLITKTFTFAPAKVGLVIEADTYTPPFYKGKALFSPQSTLKVVAFPEFVTSGGYQIPAEDLVYTWRVDGKVMPDASGFGKSSYIMQGGLITRNLYVTAEVTAYNSPLTAVKTIEVAPTSPEIVMYEDNLLYGTQRQLGFTSGIYLPKNEVKLIAEPYYLSVGVPDSLDTTYTWTLNGQKISPLSHANMIGLENRSNNSGVATLGLAIEHLTKFLQAPEISLQVEFEKTQ